MPSLSDLLSSRPGLQPDQGSPASGSSGGILSGVLAPLVSAVTALSATIQKLVETVLATAQAKAKDQPPPKQAAAQQQQPAAARPAAKPAPAEAGVPGGPGTPAPAKGGGPAIPNIGGLITGNPVVAALGGIPAALGALTAAVTPFVRAFNPAIVEMFGMALEDVQATIGQALAPILEVFTGALRQVNDIIAPTFERLRPVVEAFAQHLVGVLMPALDVFLELGKALMPLVAVAQQVQKAIDSVFLAVVNALSGGLALLAPLIELIVAAMQPNLALLQIFAKALQGVSQVVQTLGKILGAAFQGLLDVLGALLAPLLGELPTLTDVFQTMQQVVSQVVRQLVLFAANLFAIIGFTSGLNRLRQAFTQERGTGRVAAPKDLGFTSLEDQMKKLTLAAAGAIGTGSAARTQEELLGDIGSDIQRIADGGPQFGQWIRDIIGLLEAISEAVGGKVKAGVQAGRAALDISAANGPLGPLGYLLAGGRR